MITSNDIQTIDCETISYIDENNNTYQFETWDPMTLQELEDAKSQFAIILNIIINMHNHCIVDYSDRAAEAIEFHMNLNGFDGHVDVYKSK